MKKLQWSRPSSGPKYLSHCCAAMFSAFKFVQLRNFFHQERLQNLVEHCGQDKAVGPSVDHVADMCKRL